MSVVTGVKSQSATLGALKTHKSYADDAKHGESTLLIVSGVGQTNAGNTVTSVVISSQASTLPNLSLEDVLERNGVNDNAQVLLQADDSATLVKIQSNSSGPSNSVVISEGQNQDAQDAIDSIESANAVVVQVETTNNIQTVTVHAADIDTLYTNATMELNDAVNQASSNVLLLKNGWAYTNMESSPLDLPLGPPEQKAGDGWSVWRRAEGEVHEIRDTLTGLWNRLTGQVVDTSPKTPAEITGAFQTHTVDQQILWTSTSTTTLQLSPEGIFTHSRTSLTSSTNILPDVSYVLHSVSSPGRSNTSFSGTAQSNGIQTAALGSQKQLSSIAGDMFGSYRILEDGVTLELQFADGAVEKRLFLKTSEQNLTIGGRRYIDTGDVSSSLLDDLMRMLAETGEGDQRGKWLKALADALRKSTKTLAQAVPEQPVTAEAALLSNEETLQGAHLSTNDEKSSQP